VWEVFAEVERIIVDTIFEIVAVFLLYETTYGCYGVCPKCHAMCSSMP
jgi:hypothetical protein